MTRSATILLVLLLSTMLAGPADAAPKPLDDAVRGLVKRSLVGSSTSVVVRDGAGDVIVSIRPDVPHVPASNQKLVTIATVLRVLGPDARLPTSLVASAPPVNGVIKGNVRLVGGGDPTFSTRTFGDAAYGIFVATPERLAARLKATGVRRITGRILADPYRFDALTAGLGWKPSFTPTECPPLSALTINRAPTTPALSATRRVRAALLKAGIRVGPAALASGPTGTGTVVAKVESAAVIWLATEAGKFSDNFVAEMLLKAVAAKQTGRGSTRVGARIARDTLAGFGVPLDGVVVADGSGLSSQNRLSAAAISLLLSRIADDPTLGHQLPRTLAVAGIDGTLMTRMSRGPAHGFVQAKTGTLNNVSALSGYAGDYAFSILIERPNVDQLAAHRLQDAIAQLLARRAT